MNTFKNYLNESIDYVNMMVSQYRNISSKPKEITISKYIKGSAKACFINSEKYVMKHPDCKYVVGIIMYTGVPITHTFVKCGNDYIDVTLEKNEDTIYYSVVELSFEEMESISDSTKHGRGHIDLYSINKFYREK